MFQKSCLLLYIPVMSILEAVRDQVTLTGAMMEIWHLDALYILTEANYLHL